MALDLTTPAPEEGAYVITAAITDEDGTALIPTTLTWTLTDADGQIINDLQNTTIAAPAATNNIVLSGDDLAMSNANKPVRILTLNGTYTSTYGTGLPLREQCKFSIEDFT